MKTSKENNQPTGSRHKASKKPKGKEPVSKRHKVWTAAKIALYIFMWFIAWGAIAFSMAVVLIMVVVLGLVTSDGTITPRQANNSVLAVILIIGTLFLGIVWLMRKAKSLSYRTSRYVLLVCTVIGLLIGVPASLLGVWKPESGSSANNSTTTIKEKESTVKRYQYMVCTDLSYRHYTDEQMKNPNVGFTDGGKDYCAENGQGKMLKLVETRSEADKIRQDGQNSARAEYIPDASTSTLSQSKDKETCRTDYTYHGYKREPSDALAIGEYKVKQQGVDGKRVVCRNSNGDITSDKVIQKPIDEIEVYGTAIPPRNDYPGSKQCPAGTELYHLPNSTYYGCR